MRLPWDTLRFSLTPERDIEGVLDSRWVVIPSFCLEIPTSVSPCFTSVCHVNVHLRRIYSTTPVKTLRLADLPG
ncbi:MAG: hypothetical protein P8179_14220 [Candidatus Thiodiazotropha sp.]